MIKNDKKKASIKKSFFILMEYGEIPTLRIENNEFQEKEGKNL